MAHIIFLALILRCNQVDAPSLPVLFGLNDAVNFWVNLLMEGSENEEAVGTTFMLGGGPHNKGFHDEDYNGLGSVLESPLFGSYHVRTEGFGRFFSGSLQELSRDILSSRTGQALHERKSAC